LIIQSLKFFKVNGKGKGVKRNKMGWIEETKHMNKKQRKIDNTLFKKKKKKGKRSKKK